MTVSESVPVMLALVIVLTSLLFLRLPAQAHLSLQAASQATTISNAAKVRPFAPLWGHINSVSMI